MSRSLTETNLVKIQCYLPELFLCCRYGLGMIYYKQEKFSLAEMHFQKALDINPQSSVLLCHIGVVSTWHLTGLGRRVWGRDEVRRIFLPVRKLAQAWSRTGQILFWRSRLLVNTVKRVCLCLADELLFFPFWNCSLFVCQVQHALKKSEKALDTLNKAINIDPKNPLCKFHRASVLFANEKYKVSLGAAWWQPWNSWSWEWGCLGSWMFTGPPGEHQGLQEEPGTWEAFAWASATLTRGLREVFWL